MKSKNGFTIIEIVLLIVLLGVVGGLVFPKYRTMLYQSRESRTKANLGDLRGALAIYYSDNSGIYPSDEGTPETRLVGSLTPTYLKKIPPVDLPHLHSKKLNTVEDRFDDLGNWMYSTLHGFVAVNCSHKDTRGEIISRW